MVGETDGERVARRAEGLYKVGDTHIGPMTSTVTDGDKGQE